MSRSMDQRRIARKYANELSALAGDDGSTAKNVGSYASTGLSAITEGVAKYQSDKANAAAQAAAQSKSVEAQKAAIDAQTEKDPYGPMHIKAQQLAVEANALAQKAGMSSSLTPADGGKGGKHKDDSGSFSSSPYFWPAIGAGVLVVGAVGYKMFAGGSSRGGYMASRRGR